ncbi:hypothetical protein PF010_g1716 [Phytophthora fragariae]|uniref:Uncharacterized protein n=1 Tax=Phytophthora fragariae TaxID=53985 RepID=A0A6G0LZ71_9STRA|nr:hypothetical protein PF010_g1716 [Phytophthora fragariae]
MTLKKKAHPKKTQQKKASRVKAKLLNAPQQKASKKNTSQNSAPSKVSKPKRTLQMQRKSNKLTSRPKAPVAVQAMHNAGSEMLEESDEMEEVSQDDAEELSDLDHAEELEQMAEDISGEMETKMRAPGKYAHTTRVQLDGMICWMEKLSYHAIYLGESTAGKGMAHGAGVTKLSGFASMAEYVHNYAMQNDAADPRHSSKWDKKTCQSRWNSQFKRYKATRERVMKQTGFGITEEMMMRGVQVEDLIEKACPFYERMDAMFWEQANVEPVSQIHEPVLSEDEDMRVVGTADGLNCQQAGENARDPDDHEFRFPDYRERLEPDNASDSDETVLSFSRVNVNYRSATVGIENQCPSPVRAGCGDALPTNLSSPKRGSERNAPATRRPLSELLNTSNRSRFSWAPTANTQLLPATTSSPRNPGCEHEDAEVVEPSSQDASDTHLPLSRPTPTRTASPRAPTIRTTVAATSASTKAATAVKAAAAKAAAAKGAEKAQALKHKYFGSAFAVESEKTRRSAEKRAKLNIVSQEKQFEATMAFKQKELEEQTEARRQAKLEREQDRQQKQR